MYPLFFGSFSTNCARIPSDSALGSPIPMFLKFSSKVGVISYALPFIHHIISPVALAANVLLARIARARVSGISLPIPSTVAIIFMRSGELISSSAICRYIASTSPAITPAFISALSLFILASSGTTPFSSASIMTAFNPIASGLSAAQMSLFASRSSGGMLCLIS